MKYEFGVMSNKWSMEAKNDNIAFISMVMFIKDISIPIALYKPRKKIIGGYTILDMDDLSGFMDENKKDLRSAVKSIKKLGDGIWENTTQ